MNIRKYVAETDAAALDALSRSVGDDWSDYWTGDGAARFQAALATCTVFVALDADKIVGYIRARDDGGFGVYVYDLLVAESSRGAGLGHKLIDAVAAAYPTSPLYVMSDVDDYYTKQGFERIGSIFQIN